MNGSVKLEQAACGGSQWRMGPKFFKCFLLLYSPCTGVHARRGNVCWTFVSMLVCLSVSDQHNCKSYGQMFVKFGEQIDYEPQKIHSIYSLYWHYTVSIRVKIKFHGSCLEKVR